MKIRKTRKKIEVNKAPFFFFVVSFTAILTYVALLLAHVGSGTPFIASLGPSRGGFSIGFFSLGYAPSAIIALLAALSLFSWAKGADMPSAKGVGAGITVGILVGSSLILAHNAEQNEVWLHSIKTNSGGFTLYVNYNSTTLILGRNITFEYVLTDDSYQLVTPYYLFGGQFSMVVFNSTGQQVVAFRAPITFNRAASQYYVELKPGETWHTLLSWNGTVFTLNGGRFVASPGRYTLASYAVLQDANVSLYVLLHAPDIALTIVKGQ